MTLRWVVYEVKTNTPICVCADSASVLSVCIAFRSAGLRTTGIQWTWDNTGGGE